MEAWTRMVSDEYRLVSSVLLKGVNTIKEDEGISFANIIHDLKWAHLHYEFVII